MFRIVRRGSYDTRIEMAPLLDVIFLLLTFFIYSLVLSVRAEILPVSLPTVTSGEAADAAQVIAITVDRSGGVFLNGDPAALDGLADRLRVMRADRPAARFYVAFDAEQGQIDRAPLFLRLIDTLRRAGIEDFNLVGQPENSR